MHTEYWQNAHTKQVIRVSSRRDPRLNDGEIWLQITEAEYNAIRAVNAHEAAQRLAEILRESDEDLAHISESMAFRAWKTKRDAALAEWDKVTK